MSEWLYKKEEYTPKQSNNSYIDRTLNTLMNILSKIRYINNNMKSKNYYFINPVAKFSFTLILIGMISYTKNTLSLTYIFLCLLIVLFSIHKEDILKCLSLAFIAFAGNLIVLTPSLFMGNFNSFFIVIKSTLMVLALNLFIFTTKWHHITKVLKFFRIPDIFIFMLDITLKYIVSFAESSVEMFNALKMRTIGANADKKRSNFGIIGTIFLKSKEQSEELYSAMECRGFTGEYKSLWTFNFKKTDYIYTFIYILFIIGYIYIEIS